MSSKVTTSIVLYKSQKKKNGKHPAKLRVTYNRKQMYYSIDTKDRIYEFTSDEFEKVLTPKPRGINKVIQLEFSLIESKAKDIIASMDTFSFRGFKTKFGIAGGDLSNVIFYFKRRIKELDVNQQISSKGQHTTAMNNLIKYFGTNRIDFREITIPELEKYERWLKDRGLSTSMVRYCIVPIRTLFNVASSEGAISKDSYPFGRQGYQIPVGRNVKKALKIKEIGNIYNYECEEYSTLDESRDMWIFSYLMNGANFTDIARLKYGNISDQTISFYRKKTYKTSRSPKPIVVALTEELKKFIEKWGNEDKSHDNYVFPILRTGMSEKAIINRLDKYITNVNANISVIAKEVGIEKHVTTYTARHSFSTILKRSGVSTEFIGESLGHTNLRTTELYLDSFEDDMKREVAKHLTAF